MFLYQIRGRYIRCYVLPVITDAWVYAYINVQHICTLIRGRVAREERAGFAGKILHKISVLTMKDFSPDYERL